jgi:hypothetical protein
MARFYHFPVHTILLHAQSQTHHDKGTWATNTDTVMPLVHIDGSPDMDKMQQFIQKRELAVSHSAVPKRTSTPQPIQTRNQPQSRLNKPRSSSQDARNQMRSPGQSIANLRMTVPNTIPDRGTPVFAKSHYYDASEGHVKVDLAAPVHGKHRHHAARQVSLIRGTRFVIDLSRTLFRPLTIPKAFTLMIRLASWMTKSPM